MESRDTPTKFVLDVVALLEALDDREYIPVFLEMLEYDGPDVEGAVAALVEHKQVNQDWIERLAAFNTSMPELLILNSKNSARASQCKMPILLHS